MARFRKKREVKEVEKETILIERENKESSWTIQVSGPVTPGELADSLLGAYTHACQIMIDQGLITKELIKDLTVANIEDSIAEITGE